MDQASLEKILSDLHLGPVRYLQTIGSTNEFAARWVSQGAPDLALVVADEQTAGRGRQGHRWYTQPGSALAISLILRSHLSPKESSIGRLTALGALAVSSTLYKLYGVDAKIKWPNDVLVNGRKICGVLVETYWLGDQVHASVLGIGVNVSHAAIPPVVDLTFPATSLEQVLDHPVERTHLLHEILAELLAWRDQLESDRFLQQWQKLLAFINEWVIVTSERNSPLEGRILGLRADGALQLLTRDAGQVAVKFGEVHLRPVDNHPE